MNIEQTENINQTDSNGLRQGLWCFFDSKDQLYLQVNYVDGKLQGWWKYYRSEGMLVYIGVYVSGIQEGEKIEYEYE